MLSDKGTHLYHSMVENDDVALIPNILNILHEALKLNPENRDAGVYLPKTESYKKDSIAKNIKIAKKNMAKKKRRTKADDYNLCVILQKVYQLDTANHEIITLRNKTKDIREGIVEKVLVEGDAQLKAIDKIMNTIVRGKAIVLLLENYDEALLLGSFQEKKLMLKRSGALNKLSDDVDVIIHETKKLMEKNKYPDAEIRLKILNKYNLYLDQQYQAVLENIRYDIYFNWAKRLNDSNQIDTASEKINLALKIKETNDAQALQTKIRNKINKVDVAASFDGWISEIDVLIGQMEIALAYKKIKTVKALTKEKDKLIELEKRKRQVVALVEAVYAAAVTDFVDGNYSTAVKGFQNVLAVSRTFKDARDYYKKAKSELEIFDLY